MTVQVCGLPFLFCPENFAFLFGRGTLGYDRMGQGVAHIPRRAGVYPLRRSVALRRYPPPVRSFYDGVCLALLIV